MPDTTPTITSRSGVLLVVCAPSGTGKTTLIQRLRDEFRLFHLLHHPGPARP